MVDKEPPVGVINSEPDIIYLISQRLEEEGFNTATANLSDITANPNKYTEFLLEHNPRVLVVDIPIPYDSNWGLVSNLMGLEESRGRGFILTSTNPTEIKKTAGKTGTLEIIERPFDLDALAKKVIETYQAFKKKSSIN